MIEDQEDVSRRCRFNEVLVAAMNDKSLKWQDFGLLSYLLSSSVRGVFRPDELYGLHRTGRTGIYKILARLASRGYVSSNTIPGTREALWSVNRIPGEGPQ